VDDKREWSLHSQKKKKKKGEVAPHVETCKKCFATYKPTPVCPVCGYQAENRERFIKQEEGELEELKRKEQEETEKKQQKLLIATAKTLEELEMVAKILGYKKGWAYRVFESRKNKGVPRYKAAQFSKGKRTASNLDLNEKEKVAKLFCLNSKAFQCLEESKNGIYLLENPITKTDGNFVASTIFNYVKVNSSHKFFLHERYRKHFFEMFKYPWDVAFIVNYVKTVRQRKIFIDPNQFTGPIQP